MILLHLDFRGLPQEFLWFLLVIVSADNFQQMVGYTTKRLKNFLASVLDDLKAYYWNYHKNFDGLILICLVLTNPEYPALIKFHIFRIRKSGIAISYKRAPPSSSFTRLFQTRPTSGIFPHPYLPTPHSFPSSKGLDSTSTFGPPEDLMTSIHPSVRYHFFRASVFIRNLGFPKSGYLKMKNEKSGLQKTWKIIC